MLRRALFCLILTSTISPAALIAGEFSDTVGDLADSSTRWEAIQELTDAGDEAFDDLLAGLEHESAEVRANCARLLGALGKAGSVEPLLNLVDAKREGADAGDANTDPADDNNADPADDNNTDPADDNNTDPADDNNADPADDNNADPADDNNADPADDNNADPTEASAEETKAPEAPKLGDESVRVRVAAIQALSMYGGKPQSATIGKRLLTYAQLEGLEDTETYALAEAMIALQHVSAQDLMDGFLELDSKPALGFLAVRYFAIIGNEASLNRLVAFLDKKQVVFGGDDAGADEGGEGTTNPEGGAPVMPEGSDDEEDDSQLRWAFDRNAWQSVRSAAVLVLVRAGHAKAADYLIEELSDDTIQPSNALVAAYEQSAAEYGAKLIQPVIEELKSIKPRGDSPELTPADSNKRNRLVAFLGRTGSAGLRALIAMAEESIAEREAEKADEEVSEEDLEVVDPMAMREPPEGEPKRTIGEVFNLALDRFAEQKEGRQAIFAVLEQRSPTRNDKVDYVYLTLFDKLLGRTNEESRKGLLEIGLNSSEPEIQRRAVQRFVGMIGAHKLDMLASMTNPQTAGEGARMALAESIGVGNVPMSLKRDMLVDLLDDPSTLVRRAAWNGVGSSAEQEDLEVFRLAMDEREVLVLEIAGNALARVGERWNLGDSRNAELRDEYKAMVFEFMERPALMAGIVNGFSTLNRGLFEYIPASEQNTIRQAARDGIESEQAALRIASARASYALKGEKWNGRVLRQFIKEEDMGAAGAMAQSIAQFAPQLTPEQRELVPDAIDRMLRLVKEAAPAHLEMREKQTDPSLTPLEHQKINLDNSASDAMGSFSSLVNALGQIAAEETRSKLQEFARATLETHKAGEDTKVQETIAGAVINALSQMRDGATGELVQEIYFQMPNDEISNNAINYLRQNLSSNEQISLLEKIAPVAETRRSQLAEALLRDLGADTLSVSAVSRVIAAYGVFANRSQEEISADKRIGAVTDAFKALIQTRAFSNNVEDLEALKDVVPAYVMAPNNLNNLISRVTSAARAPQDGSSDQ